MAKFRLRGKPYNTWGVRLRVRLPNGVEQEIKLHLRGDTEYDSETLPVKVGTNLTKWEELKQQLGVMISWTDEDLAKS